jgi:2,3-dimethylmalate lyase
MSKRKQLRKLLDASEILLAPGAYDALTAKLVVGAGFSAVYATGAGIANSQYGFSDVGLTTMTEILQQVQKIVDAVDCPVVADIDTGFGNFLNVMRTVKSFERVGVAAIQLEDQIFPKKCGHFEGKDVIGCEEMVGKVKAAADARIDADLVLIVRTDSRAVHGIDSAIERAHLYIEAGADAIFVEAPTSKEELSRIASEISAFKVANMVEGGKTPLCEAGELQKMGYDMVIYANSALRAAVKAIQRILAHLKENGSTSAVLDHIITMEERNRITGLAEVYAMEQKYFFDR